MALGSKKKKGEYKDYIEDFGGNNSNMKLVYILIGLTVVTVALVVLLVMFLNGNFGSASQSATPNRNTAVSNTATSGSEAPASTPTPAIEGEVVSISGLVDVDQIPVGLAPVFTLGSGDKQGYIIIDNSVVYQGDLILANGSTALTENYKPMKISNIYNESRSDAINYPVGVSGSAVSIEQRALSAIVNMLKGAEAAGNKNYFIDKAYSADDADLDYRTGLAFDIGFIRLEGQTGKFAELPQGQWIIENAYLYGFVQRYTSDKTAITGQSQDMTHYRYVGFPHSYVMKVNNMCMEEYLPWLRTTQKVNVMIGDKLGYEIMYFYADPTSVDGKTSYKLSDSAYEAYTSGEARITVSGDNFGGFIVTVIYN